MRTKWLQAWLTAVVLSALGLAAKVWAGVSYPPQELFGSLTQLLGVPRIFQLIHAIFGLGQAGKYFAFFGVSVLWLGGLTLLGLSAPWVGALAVGFGMLFYSSVPVALGYALAYLALRYALGALLRPVRPGDGTGDGPGDGARRTVLGAMWGGSVLAVAGGLTGLFRTVDGAAPAEAVAEGGPLPSGITPTKDFYYVSKNLEAFDPKIDGEKWRLKVDGLVKTPLELSLDDLKQFDQRRLELTLSCISNPVGGPLISNGIWEGFPVADLLRKAGVQGGAKYIVWTAADGYEESLPLGEAFGQDVLLVHSLNGDPLPQKNGFPLRVLIPGRYGMKQPRWITGIKVTEQDLPGYWVRRGWSRTARVEITSRIDQPQELNPTVKAGQATAIRGIAFGGTLPITKVEVSTDGGGSWQEARLVKPRSRYAWTMWELPWTPKSGSYEVAARAYSGSQVQKSAEKDALPEGATGYHHFIVKAS